MPKTLLVFPPGWSPVGPYLALPVLKSYLQEVEQYKVDIVDLNVEFYDDLLSFRHVLLDMSKSAVKGIGNQRIRLVRMFN